MTIVGWGSFFKTAMLLGLTNTKGLHLVLMQLDCTSNHKHFPIVRIMQLYIDTYKKSTMQTVSLTRFTLPVI